MFKLRYNILVAIQVILGIINYVLILKVFGVSIKSDAYLLALSSFSIFLLLVALPIGQFMQYYNDLKVISIKKAHEFYNCSLLFSFLLGIIACVFLNIFLPLVIKIFAFNIDIDRFMLFKNIVRVLSFGLIFYPINQINEQLFNAEMKFGLPYILSIIPLLLITITQIIMIHINSANIVYLAIAQSVGLLGIAIFGSIYISKTLIKFKIIRWQNQLLNEIKNSCLLKLGGILWSISSSILFNNFLVMFPIGYISYFYYARKILDIANNFSIGPTVKIFNSKLSKFIAQKDALSIIKISKFFLIYGGFAFIIILTISFFLQTPILKIIANNKLSIIDLKMISKLFLSLCPWYFLMFIDIPFAALVQLSKKAKETFMSDLLFMFFMFIFLFNLKPIFGIFSIGITTVIAQIANILCYIFVSKSVIKKLKNNLN